MLTIKIRVILFCIEFNSLISVHSFPLSHHLLKNALNFMELHGDFQNQCLSVLPSTVGDVTQSELSCSQDAAFELGEVLSEGHSLGV